MSETTRKTEIENIQNSIKLDISKQNKQKHNAKRRRCNKSKGLSGSKNNLEVSKVDKVVKFLCETIANKESDIPVSNHSQNSKCQAMCSANNLNSLFENLQIHSYNNMKSLPTKELEEIKQELKKNTSTKEEETNEQINLNQDYPGTSLTSSESKKMAPNLKEICNLDFLKIEENLKKIDEYFNVKSGTEFNSKEIEHTLKNQNHESSKKFCKKKVKNKKSSDSPAKKDDFRCNERVFLNSDLQENYLGESTSLESPQFSKNKEQNSKSSFVKTDTKFTKYLSPEELQSVSNFGVLMTGIIRINQKNYKEAYITAPDKGMDILIEGLKDRNRALEGDEVYFVLKPKEHHRINSDCVDIQRTAVVVALKTLNHNREAIGSLNILKNKNSNFILFSPRDSRLPRIRIRKNNWPTGFLKDPNSFKDKLYSAKINQWNDLRYAEGELVKEVGDSGDLEAETNAITLNFGLNTTPYSDALKRFLPSLPFKITEADLVNREDFRKECVFTIDPPTAVDLDDAVSCKLLPNGNYEVGVHISDVSYFLREGTPLDKAVSERATTVYLVQKTYHMLPYELCRLCSLTPGEDKLSFSVIWEITPDCNIKKYRFARTVINSCAQLTYDQVQSVIDKLPSDKCSFPKIHGGHSSENIKEIVLFLNKVAVYLRNKRFSSGALRIDQKKICFSLDENKLPIGFREEVHKTSHQLIEELTLLTNITVAEMLNSTFPEQAFLRSHPPPLSYILERLQKTFEKYGIILDISSSGSIQASLQKYSGNDTASTARMLVLNNALAKPMARARYYCGGFFTEEVDRRHYALNVPLYTHFTSPIRRFADVMVHRLLASALNYREPPNWTEDYIQSIAANCNKQKYAAKLAEEMSVELNLALFIELQGSMVCEAVVCDVKDKSFDCIALPTGMHQRLYFEHIKGDIHQEKDDGILRLIIKWPIDENFDTETTQIIEMFSIVKIELKRHSALKTEARLLRYQ